MPLPDLRPLQDPPDRPPMSTPGRRRRKTPGPALTQRGYMVMIHGLNDGFEWEARYTGMFTSKRRAMAEMRAMRKTDGCEVPDSARFVYAVVAVDVPKIPKR